MFLVDWFYGVLASLGLWQKEAKILFLGLDNAFKSTLLNMLDHEDYYRRRWVIHDPFRHPICIQFSIGKIRFKTFNVGGHQTVRRLLEDYYARFDAVVYLLDVYEEELSAESKSDLDALLSDESLARVPFLILGNNNDISEDELLLRFGLTNFTTGKGIVNLTGLNVRPLEVFMYCLPLRGIEGFREAFMWLSQYIR